MDKRELAKSYIDRINACHFKNRMEIHETKMGMKFVLFYLNSHIDDEVTAGTLATVLKVSTARVAVLIKKLEEKGLILKKSSALDGRKTIVEITDAGKLEVSEHMELGIDKMVKLIECIGEEEMEQFISTFAKITELMKKSGGCNNV